MLDDTFDPLELLRPKQRAFVVEYLKDRNGAQAAIRAGYSERTARQQASELLTKPDIAAAVSNLSRRVELQVIDGVTGSKGELLEILWGIARNGQSDSARVSAVKALAPTYGLAVDASKATPEPTAQERKLTAQAYANELRSRGIDPLSLTPAGREALRAEIRSDVLAEMRIGGSHRRQ